MNRPDDARRDRRTEPSQTSRCRDEATCRVRKRSSVTAAHTTVCPRMVCVSFRFAALNKILASRATKRGRAFEDRARRSQTPRAGMRPAVHRRNQTARRATSCAVRRTWFVRTPTRMPTCNDVRVLDGNGPRGPAEGQTPLPPGLVARSLVVQQSTPTGCACGSRISRYFLPAAENGRTRPRRPPAGNVV